MNSRSSLLASPQIERIDAVERIEQEMMIDLCFEVSKFHFAATLLSLDPLPVGIEEEGQQGNDNSHEKMHTGIYRKTEMRVPVPGAVRVEMMSGKGVLRQKKTRNIGDQQHSPQQQSEPKTIAQESPSVEIVR